jgi:hypothetical protein
MRAFLAHFPQLSCGIRAPIKRLNSSGTSTIAIEDVTITNASIGLSFAKPRGTDFDASSAAAQIITPNRFAALLIRNVTANGGHVGMLVNDNVSNPASGLMIYDVTTTGFKFPVNISWDPCYHRQYDNGQWFNGSWKLCWQVGSRATHGDCNWTLPILQSQPQLLTRPWQPQAFGRGPVT